MANQTFDEADLPIIIGRDPDADFTLHDQWVSRHHCEIFRCDDDLVARDLDSKHGTLLNGQSIVEKILNSGDTLQIGMSEVLLTISDTATLNPSHRDTVNL